jgi:predicted permease
MKSAVRRRQLERDLEDELSYHLEQRRVNGAPGVAFGSTARIREVCREMWTFHRLENVWRELRQAARVLTRSPGHSSAVIALIALGVAINTATFGLINALFIRQLPVREPSRLVTVSGGWSTPAFEDFRRAQSSFEGVLATGSLLGTVINTETREYLAGVRGGIATGNYFQVLGVNPALGRLFTEDDDRPGNAEPVMVITHRFWQRQFGGDATVLGKRLFLFGTPFTIIGVTPPEFQGEMPGRIRDFWVPLGMQPMADLGQGDLRNARNFPWLSVMARLRPGVSIEQARAETLALFSRLMEDSEERNRIRRASLVLEPAGSGLGFFRSRMATQLQILAGTVLLMLLIVCANLATLLLARGTVRQREMAVRQALGCGRGRLIRQLLIEALLLAVCGGALGAALAPAIATGFLLIQPTAAPQGLDLSLDRTVLAFAAALSLVTAVSCSLIPALRLSRTSIEPALKSASRSATGAGGRQKAMRSLLAFQTAVCTILVTASILFVRSLLNLAAIEPGFDREHIITATVNSKVAGYLDADDQSRLARRVVERLSALPGVESASAGLCAVMMGCSRMTGVNVEGHSYQPGDPRIWINPVSPNYFETAGMRLIMGRSFGRQDTPGSPRVAVVTEALARHHLPGHNPVGKRFTEARGAVSGPPIEIIGVVRDVKFVNPRDQPIRMAFLSIEQVPSEFSYVQVRTAGAPEPLVSAVRDAIIEVDSRLQLRGPETLTSALDSTLSRELLLGRISTIFAALALFLACFGIYGATSYSVAARSAELGIRMAVGARPGVVRRQVIADSLKAVAPGILLGLACAWAAGRVIQSLLFGITPQDGFTFATVTAFLVVTTTIAAWYPAARASRIDPLAALRCE